MNTSLKLFTSPTESDTVIDLTLSDDDQPRGFKMPRKAQRAPVGNDAVRSRERSVPFFTPQRRPARTASNPSTVQDGAALATPPISQPSRLVDKQGRKRQSTESRSPSPSYAAAKRAKHDATKCDTAQPGSSSVAGQPEILENTVLETENGVPSTPTRERPAGLPVTGDDTAPEAERLAPTPVVQRNRIIERDGHVFHDPSVFSPRPFKWEEWSRKDYLALSVAVESSFDADNFAKKLSNLDGHRTVTTEEVTYMLRAAVTRPLRLAEVAVQRGQEGMDELREYMEQHGTQIRQWGHGKTKVKGEFLGLEDEGVVIALATTRYGKAEQDILRKSGAGLYMEKGSGQANLELKRLSKKDAEYLKTILCDHDLKVFEQWEREIRAEMEEKTAV